MGLEVVIEELREKGKREADRTRQETQAEVRKILDSAQEKAAGIKIEADRDVERQTAHILNQEISAANLLVKRQHLNTQKELLDQVYAAALVKIRDLPGEFHREALKHLLAKAKTEIPEGIIHASSRDRDTLNSVISSDPTLKGYQIGTPADIEGGIVIESKDGELLIDYSYRTMMSGIWETWLKDASDVLFG